jgi:hypothetical protein
MVVGQPIERPALGRDTGSLSLIYRAFPFDRCAEKIETAFRGGRSTVIRSAASPESGLQGLLHTRDSGEINGPISERADTT